MEIRLGDVKHYISCSRARLLIIVLRKVLVLNHYMLFPSQFCFSTTKYYVHFNFGATHCFWGAQGPRVHTLFPETPKISKMITADPGPDRVSCRLWINNSEPTSSKEPNNWHSELGNHGVLKYRFMMFSNLFLAFYNFKKNVRMFLKRSPQQIFWIDKAESREQGFYTQLHKGSGRGNWSHSLSCILWSRDSMS